MAAWGWPRPGTGGKAGQAAREETPCLLASSGHAFVFSLCFPSVWPQRTSRLPLIVCRVIKGQMSRRSLAAAGSPNTDTMAAVDGRGGPWAGNPAISCAECFSEGHFAQGSQAHSSSPGNGLPFTEAAEAQKAQLGPVGPDQKPGLCDPGPDHSDTWLSQSPSVLTSRTGRFQAI